jgi:hypothetical protein
VELAVPLLVVLSGVGGILLRNSVSQIVGRVLLALGVGAFVLGIAVLGLTVAGWMPLGTWTAALTAVLLLGLAALVLPFAVAVRCCRASADA